VAVRPAGPLIGAPVTQDFIDKIGADAYGANAASAVEKAKIANLGLKDGRLRIINFSVGVSSGYRAYA
jgi:hypothetical protein